MRYAIHKVTKRHFLVDEEARNWDGPVGEYHFAEADADGWIPWEGGACPLPDDSVFVYKLRSGEIHDGLWASRWEHDNMSTDIIAYRPILDETSEPEAPDDSCACGGRGMCPECLEPEAVDWNGDGLPPVGCECDCWHTGTHQGVVTVRYMGSEMCVLLNHDYGSEQCGPIDAYSFRPIRSEEDRLTDEALDAIEADGDDKRTIRSTVARMINAGYRKQEVE